MRAQFGADARRPVAMRHARAQQHFGETIVILIALRAKLLDCIGGLYFVVATMLQPRAQLALRMFAASHVFRWFRPPLPRPVRSRRLRHPCRRTPAAWRAARHRVVWRRTGCPSDTVARFPCPADAFAAVAVPGTGFLDQVVVDAQFDQLALARGTLAVENFELGLPEWWGHLVLDHLDAGFRADHLVALLDCADTADIQSNGRVELQRVAAGGGFRVAEHHADLHADLVDED